MRDKFRVGGETKLALFSSLVPLPEQRSGKPAARGQKKKHLEILGTQNTQKSKDGENKTGRQKKY